MNSNDIRELVYSLGAEVCGMAEATSFVDAPAGFHPKDIYPDAKTVIVYGRQNSKAVFDLKTNTPYTFERNKLLALMDEISFKLSWELQKAGFNAVPIPSAEPYDYWDAANRQGRGILSLRHAARLAGLGCLGKNTLLVNKKYGNRLWLGAVITDAEMENDVMEENLCPRNCSICIDACPQGALDGMTVDQKKCRQICMTVTEGGGLLYACNICRKACPFART